MSSSPEMLTDYEREVEKNFRHNAIFNFLDGTTFWLGYSFITPAIIIPLYVSRFTSNTLIIGLVAFISAAGFFLPQLFTANWVEKAPLKKYFPVNIGLFTERLPIILMPITAALFAASQPMLALASIIILFAWHTFGAGLIAVGWQDMLAKVIPLDRRGRFMGLTNFGGTAAGVVGAATAGWLLNTYPFPSGYVVSFSLAALFIFISWIMIAQNREVPVYSREKTVSTHEYWRSLPLVLKADRNFRQFIIAYSIISLGNMAAGFIAVYAKDYVGLPEGQVASFTTIMLIGQTLANLLFGVLADRFGYKVIIEIGTLAAILSLVLTLLAPSGGWYYLIFALRGIQMASILMALLIALEFSVPEIRPTYIGLSNTLVGVASGVSPILGGLLAQSFGYIEMFIAAGVISTLGLLYLRFLVRDPRRSRPASLVVAPPAGPAAKELVNE